MKKKFRKRDIYVFISMANITWFAIAVLIINYTGHEVSNDLVQWWFISWVCEFLTLGGVTVCKTVKEKRAENISNEEEEEDE